MKKKKSVFVNLHNEVQFWPLWKRYYSRFFAPEDTYVIHSLKPKRVPFDDWLEAEANSQNPAFIRIPFHEKQICEFPVVTAKINEVQRQLLESYENVLFTEVDEFICCEIGLGNYIDSFQGDFVRCSGWNVLHDHENEPEIDFAKSIMPQRKYWYHDHLYDKPLLSKVPLTWIAGFHNCSENPDWNASGSPGGRLSDPNLYLVHLRNLDLGLCTARALERQKNEDDSEYSKAARQGGAGFHHFLTGFELRAWFDLGKPYRVLIPDFAKEFPI